MVPVVEEQVISATLVTLGALRGPPPLPLDILQTPNPHTRMILPLSPTISPLRQPLMLLPMLQDILLPIFLPRMRLSPLMISLRTL